MSAKRDFSGKVVIITGSSSGIGAATAILFAQLGAQVVVTVRNEQNVAEVAEKANKVSLKGLKALQVVADVINDENCKRLINVTTSKFGKLDILVNNAGAAEMDSIY